MASTPQKKGVHWAVKAWVIFHAFAIIVWALPRPNSEIRSGRAKPIGSDYALVWNEQYLVRSPIRFYLLTAGFWQYWDMFAPNPSTWDGYADAEITYQDGTKKQWEYPRMSKLSIFQKYFKERYRKFLERGAYDPVLWPQISQRIALINYTDPANPPVSVKFRRMDRTVAPPDAIQPVGYIPKVLFDYQVDQTRLHKDAGF